jgi:hypothetical protein
MVSGVRVLSEVCRGQLSDTWAVCADDLRTVTYELPSLGLISLSDRMQEWSRQSVEIFSSRRSIAACFQFSH